MPITINEECIGCESCVELCPEVFEMDAGGERALVKDPDSNADCVDEAVETCPVQAIVKT